MAAITAAEIMFKLSVSAAAGNTTGGTPATSLGDQVSTTEVSATVLNNLFDDVSAAENAASAVEYRCFFVHNANASNAYQNVVLWISSEIAGGASFAIGADTTAASAVGSGSAQALTVANETTAPAGVTFTAPTTQGAGISLGSIPAGSVKAVWVRRTAAASAALNNDGGVFSIWGETAAA